jgi:hypothetical protein
MQMEEAYSAGVTKLMEHEDIKEDQQIRNVRTNQRSASSTMLRIAKKPQYRITGRNKRRQKKDGERRGCLDSCHGT